MQPEWLAGFGGMQDCRLHDECVTVAKTEARRQRFCLIIEAIAPASGLRQKRASYDFTTLYTTWPHNLIKDKLVDLIERIFQTEDSLYIACNDRHAFVTFDAVINYNLWSCQKVCEALTFLLDNIYIKFGSKLYRQIVSIPMGTNCTPLEADLLLL